MVKKGIFITFEGSEGCGKTSQIQKLSDFLKSRSFDCVATREPGGTELSEQIRAILLHAKEGAKMSPKTELLLFEAARAQHVDELIRPSLNAGKIVICDRFFDSTTAYQGAARALGEELVKDANSLAVGDCIPNLTILLDIDAHAGITRARGRDCGQGDRMGSQKIEFYEAVRAAYLEIAAQNLDRFVVIDASKTIEQIAQEIESVVRERFNV